MEQNESFDVLNIWKFLKSDNEKLGEDELRDYLSEFSCPLNHDVERFLKEQSVEFAKKYQAVTYLLVSNEDNALLGYFAIAIKPISVDSELFSNNVKRKFARFSEVNKEDHTYNLSSYLIAQLGKNFSEDVTGRITGKRLLDTAVEQLHTIQHLAGGMVSFVEAENREKLLSFYENNGYKRLSTRVTTSKDPHELIQLLKLI